MRVTHFYWFFYPSIFVKRNIHVAGLSVLDGSGGCFFLVKRTLLVADHISCHLLMLILRVTWWKGPEPGCLVNVLSASKRLHPAKDCLPLCDRECSAFISQFSKNKTKWWVYSGETIPLISSQHSQEPVKLSCRSHDSFKLNDFIVLNWCLEHVPRDKIRWVKVSRPQLLFWCVRYISNQHVISSAPQLISRLWTLIRSLCLTKSVSWIFF